MAETRIDETGKSVTVLHSPVCYDLCQTIGPRSLVLLTSFYTTRETFPNIFFIVFALLHMGPIWLYQFVNLLERFGKRILYLNLLLD